LRVESVRAFPIRLKLNDRLVGGTFAYSSYQTVLVKVTCNGESGWGEAMTRSDPRATALLVEEYLGPMISKKDFDSPRTAWRSMWDSLRVRGHTRGVDVEALSGVEIAMQDAYAKVRKSSIASLLSPRSTRTVPAFAGSIFSSRGSLKSQVEVARGLGLMGAKVKVGFGATRDLAILRRVKKSWEECSLVADANGAYDAVAALKMARELGELDLAWFEEPVPADDVEGYRRISRATHVRLGAGESWFVSDFALPLREKLIQVVEPSVSRSGGVRVAWNVSQMASVQGIDFAPMVGMNSAISLAASLQVAAASERLLGVEFDPFGNPLMTQLCPGFPSLEDGKLVVPRGRGIGVEVDEAFVKRNLIS